MNNGFTHIPSTQVLNNQEEEVSAYERIQKYWWLIRRKLWLVVIFSLFGAIYKYNEILKVKELYSSVSTVILDGSSTDRAVALLGIPGSRYGYQNELYILRSDRLAKKVAENLLNNFNSKKTKDTLSILKFGGNRLATIDVISSRVRSSVRFISEEEDNIIRIQASAYDPIEASIISNAYAQTYAEFNRSESKRQIVETKEFLDQKITEVNDSTLLYELKILDYYRDNGFSTFDLSTESLISQLSELYKQLDETRIGFTTNQEEIKAIESTLEESRSNRDRTLVNSIDQFIDYYNNQILKLELEKEEELNQLTSSDDINTNTKIRVINDKLSIYKDKLEHYLDQKLNSDALLSTVDGSIAKYWIELNARKQTLLTQNKSFPARIESIESQINEYLKKLEKIPLKQLELEKLQKRRSRFSDASSKFYNRYMDMELAEASEGGYVNILDSARPNYNPINKQTTSGVFQGLLSGIALAIFLIVGIDKLDDRIKSDEDLRFSDFKVIGGIPSMVDVIEKDYGGKRFIEYHSYYISTRLLTLLQPLSTISELYRRIRSDFLFSLPDKKSKSILITSANPQEGKSVSTSNLAIVLAQSGKRVLLLDADLRRPNIEVIFGLSGKGITDYIIGNIDYDEVFYSTDIENLTIATAGTQVSNPAELLGSEAFRNFFNQVQDEYDFLIIDSPPVNSVVDAVTISELADMVMIVVRAGKTKKRDLKNALDILHFNQHKIKGILLNDISEKSYITDYNYYNNYNYYGNRPPQPVNKESEDNSNFWDKLNA